MPRLDQKLLSLWQWEGGAFPGDRPAGYRAAARAPNAGRRIGSTRGAESTELFLDFDPVLPDWPADGRAGRVAARRRP